MEKKSYIIGMTPEMKKVVDAAFSIAINVAESHDKEKLAHQMTVVRDGITTQYGLGEKSGFTLEELAERFGVKS